MSGTKRIISVAVLAAFLVNTAFADLVLADNMLAPVSRFSPIQGPEGSDISRITFILAEHLAAAKDAGGAIDHKKLVKAAREYKDSNKQLPVQFFANEIENPNSDLISIKCWIRRDKKIHKYYAVFPRQFRDGFKITVLKEEDWKNLKDELAKGIIREREENIAGAIESGVRHQSFDSVLQWAYSEESGVEHYSPGELNINYDRIVNDTIKRLQDLGIKIEDSEKVINSIQGRPCTIMAVNEKMAGRLEAAKVRLQDVNGNTLDVIPGAHLSNSYLNILLTPAEVDSLLNFRNGYEETIEDISRRLIHEIGVAFGCPILKFEKGRPVNEIDLTYNGDRNDVAEDLRTDRFALQDLETNIETRDFADGSGYEYNEGARKLERHGIGVNAHGYRFKLNRDPEAIKRVDRIGGKYTLIFTRQGELLIIDSEYSIKFGENGVSRYELSPDKKSLVLFWTGGRRSDPINLALGDAEAQGPSAPTTGKTAPSKIDRQQRVEAVVRGYPDRDIPDLRVTVGLTEIEKPAQMETPVLLRGRVQGVLNCYMDLSLMRTATGLTPIAVITKKDSNEKRHYRVNERDLLDYKVRAIIACLGAMKSLPGLDEKAQEGIDRSIAAWNAYLAQLTQRTPSRSGVTFIGAGALVIPAPVPAVAALSATVDIPDALRNSFAAYTHEDGAKIDKCRIIQLPGELLSSTLILGQSKHGQTYWLFGPGPEYPFVKRFTLGFYEKDTARYDVSPDGRYLLRITGDYISGYGVREEEGVVFHGSARNIYFNNSCSYVLLAYGKGSTLWQLKPKAFAVGYDLDEDDCQIDPAGILVRTRHADLSGSSSTASTAGSISHRAKDGQAEEVAKDPYPQLEAGGRLEGAARAILSDRQVQELKPDVKVSEDNIHVPMIYIRFHLPGADADDAADISFKIEVTDMGYKNCITLFARGEYIKSWKESYTGRLEPRAVEALNAAKELPVWHELLSAAGHPAAPSAPATKTKKAEPVISTIDDIPETIFAAIRKSGLSREGAASFAISKDNKSIAIYFPQRGNNPEKGICILALDPAPKFIAYISIASPNNESIEMRAVELVLGRHSEVKVAYADGGIVEYRSVGLSGDAGTDAFTKPAPSQAATAQGAHTAEAPAQLVLAPAAIAKFASSDRLGGVELAKDIEKAKGFILQSPTIRPLALGKGFTQKELEAAYVKEKLRGIRRWLPHSWYQDVETMLERLVTNDQFLERGEVSYNIYKRPTLYRLTSEQMDRIRRFAAAPRGTEAAAQPVIATIGDIPEGVFGAGFNVQREQVTGFVVSEDNRLIAIYIPPRKGDPSIVHIFTLAPTQKYIQTIFLSRYYTKRTQLTAVRHNLGKVIVDYIDEGTAKQESISISENALERIAQSSPFTNASDGAASRQAEVADMTSVQDDIASMVDFDKAFGIIGGKRKEGLRKVFISIVEIIEGISRKFEGRFKDEAIRTARIGVIEGGEDGYTLAVGVDRSARTRKVGISRSFIEGIERLESRRSGNGNALRCDEIVRSLKEAAVLHELGHGFDGFSQLDLDSLTRDKDPSASKAREDYRQLLDMPANISPIALAEAIADLNIGGEGNKHYVRNKAAYIFYKFISFSPEDFVNETGNLDEEGMRKIVENYYAKYEYLKRAQAPGIEKEVAGKVVEYCNAFFGRGTPWYVEILVSRNNAGKVSAAKEAKEEAIKKAAADRAATIEALIAKLIAPNRTAESMGDARRDLVRFGQEALDAVKRRLLGSPDETTENILEFTAMRLRQAIAKQSVPAASRQGSGEALRANAPIRVTSVSVSARALSTLQSTKDDSARVGIVDDIFTREFGKGPDAMAKAAGRDNAQGEHVDYNEAQIATGEVHLYSMGTAIQNNFLAAVGKRSDRIVRIIHADAGQSVEFNLDDLDRLQRIAIEEREGRIAPEARAIPVWANHTMGVLMQARKERTLVDGVDIVLTSNIPFGAGLSNSVANCVSVTMALDRIFSWKLTPMDVVVFARSGEHDKFVGSTCGWLDQLLIVFSKKGYFAMIDYATKAITYFKSMLPRTLQRVLVDTNIPHDLAQTEYNDRNLGELPKAHDTLRALMSDRKISGSISLTLAEINHLIRLFDNNVPQVDFADRQLLLDRGIMSAAGLKEMDSVGLPSDQALLDKFEKIEYKKPAILRGDEQIIVFRHEKLSDRESFALCLRRMRHQLTSAIRTPLTGVAVEKGDVESFLELIVAEGRSLRMNGDFQITGDNGAQDALLDIGLDVGRELGIRVGGRMEGGGGGGNVGFYVDRTNEDKYKTWRRLTRERYDEWVKKQGTLQSREIKASFIEPALSDGASIIEKLPVNGKAKPYFIGMSMGGTKLHMALYKNEDGNVVSVGEPFSITWAGYAGLDDSRLVADPNVVKPDEIASLIALRISEILDNNTVKLSELNNIGCTAPGPLDAESGVIGTPERTYNLPFDHYPFCARLAERLPIGYGHLVAIGHDGKTGLEGELASGALKDAAIKVAYYVIQGSGLGGSLAVDRKYNKDIPDLTEPGHHIVGTPIQGQPGRFHFRFIVNGTKAHPLEVVMTKDPDKVYQVTRAEVQRMIRQGKCKEEDFIWAISGEKDMENIAAGVALEPLLKNKDMLVKLFGGDKACYENINEPKDLSERAISGNDKEKLAARTIIQYVGEEMGKALACLADFVETKVGRKLDRIVIGSSIGENLGISPSTGEILKAYGDDFYYHYIRESAQKELMERFGIDAERAKTLAGNIARSPIKQEIRETIGFDRSGEAGPVAGANIERESPPQPEAINLDMAAVRTLLALAGAAAKLRTVPEKPVSIRVSAVQGSEPEHIARREKIEEFRARFAKRLAEISDIGILEMALQRLRQVAITKDEGRYIAFVSMVQQRMAEVKIAERRPRVEERKKENSRLSMDSVANTILFAVHNIAYASIHYPDKEDMISGYIEEFEIRLDAIEDPKILELATRCLEVANEGFVKDSQRSSIIAEYAERVRERIPRAEISAMENIVDKAAGEINNKMERLYTFILPQTFCTEAELKADLDDKYGDRFNAEQISDGSLERFITKALTAASGKKSTSIVLIPRALIKDMPADEVARQLARLTNPDVNMRFEIADLDEQGSANYGTPEQRKIAREQFRSNTYASMFLARFIEKGMEGTSAYKLYEFYLKTHFNLSGITPIEYIEAVASGDASRLVNSYLMYRPTEKYDARKAYHALSASLIFA